MIRPSLLTVLFFALLALSLPSCKEHGVLAVLERADGIVERDYKDEVGSFERTEPGAKFRVGDAVRTGEKSLAALRLDDRGGLELQQKTLLRFLERRPGSKTQRFALEMGEATLQAANESLSVELALGVAEIDAYGRVRLARTDSGALRFEVAIGSARVLAGGERFEVTTGEVVEIRADRSIVREPEPVESVVASAEPAAITARPETDSDGMLTEIRGNGAEVRTPGDKEFVDLPPGTSEQAPGTTLRLSGESNATIRRGEEKADLDGGEYVLGKPGGPLVTTSSGNISLESGDRRVTVQVPGGSIVVHEKSRVEARASRKKGTEVVVREGGATVKGSEGTRELSAGERMMLAPGGKVDIVRGRGPEVVDLVAAPGASFVIHDPKPPAAIAFVSAGRCAKTVVLSFDPGTRKERQTVGSERVSMELGKGSHRYVVSCLDEQDELAKFAEGSITILHDSGSRRLPRGAPSTSVEADGRRYTVLYQSLLPRITVTWPNAPSGGSTLGVTSNGVAKTYSVSGKRYTFPAGALGEGEHQLAFEGGGLRSRPTTVTIRFDNAAPTASLSSPADGGFAMGAPVLVAGTALPGWTVSVGSEELPQDDQNRFSRKVPAAGERALAIRFSRRGRPMHYYLRRSGR